MKIIADENLNDLFVVDLRAVGCDVLSIREEYSGISDREVVSLTKAADLMLITEDKDFGGGDICA